MTIKEYWNLIGQEPFLAVTWEPDFSQACSFRRMLMNHKNFHFTQTPDKTNDVIFLKSPKTLFLDHFWSFLPNGDFFWKLRLCHSQLYMGLSHHAKFQKKLTSQFWKKLMDRPYLIGPFQPKPSVKTRICFSGRKFKRNNWGF